MRAKFNTLWHKFFTVWACR